MEHTGERRRNLLRMVSVDLNRSDFEDRTWKRHRPTQYKAVSA